MADTKAARQYTNVTGPRAAQLGTPGSCLSVAVSTVAGYIELDTLFPQTQTGTTGFGTQLAGVEDQFITVQAITAVVGIVLGPTATAVSTQGAFYNAPALAVVATVANGVITLPAASSGSPGICCAQIQPGSTLRFRVIPNQDLFLGYVGSTAGQMVLFQSCAAGS